jgi:WD40 repeat protein
MQFKASRTKELKKLVDEALKLVEAGHIKDSLKLIQQDITASLPLHEQAQVHAAIGIHLLYEKQDVESAFQHLLLSTELDPSASWQARYYLALIYYAKGEVVKAETEYQEVKRLAGNYVIEKSAQQRAIAIVTEWGAELQRQRRKPPTKASLLTKAVEKQRPPERLLQSAQKAKTFRVFVSSTFEDFQIERNVLQKNAFPRLRHLCEAHGARFQAIDLRWGISEEASVDQQTMPVCLAEIARCQKLTPRPNFIVLLGDRYGWRPLPATITAEEFEAIIECVESHEKTELLTHWYRRDDNARPPVYALKPRSAPGGFAEEIDEVNLAIWNRTEQQLGKILREAISKIQLSEQQRMKYMASACEQEIEAGAFNVTDAHEHVYAFIREIRGLPEDWRAKRFVDMDENDLPDREARSALERLKIRLKNYLPGNVYKHQAIWINGTITYDHLDQLCEDVYQTLKNVILKELDKEKKVDLVQKEQADHEAFGRERIQHFIGRKRFLTAIGEYIQEGSRQPLVVYGSPGSGKTALLAKAMLEAQSVHSDANIITRFIGATPASSDGLSLLQSLCHQISRAYGIDEPTIPSDYQRLISVFNERLASTASGKKLIIFIDALDQLYQRSPAENLSWVPPELPLNVRLVVTTLPGEYLTILQSKLSPSSVLELNPIPISEARILLDRWLKDADRTLQEAQQDAVLRGFETCGLPLYLKLAFEEARKWKSFDSPINLNPGIRGIIRNLFSRLSGEANHGKLLLARSLSYLAAAKNGLAEDEMLDILSTDKEVMTDFRRRFTMSPEVERLPVAVWSRLYADLEPYLTQLTADGTSVLNFYHRELRSTVETDFLINENKKECHFALARYFASQPLKLGRETFINLRKLSELPFQQAHGQIWDDLKTTLTDLQFLYSKICAANPYFLIEDYAEGFRTGYKSENLDVIVDAIRRSAHILSEDPTQLPGQIVSRLMLSDLPNVQKLVEQARKWKETPWMCPLMPSETPSNASLLGTLTGHTDAVNRLAITPDGRKVVSASFDRTLKVWDLDSGTALQTLTGHTDAVKAVAVTPDGRWIVSGSKDQTLKVWDLERGLNLTTLSGHTGMIETVAVTPDSRRAVSGSWDHTLKIWDLESKKELYTLIGHAGHVEAVALTPDGRLAVSASSDKTLKIWDLDQGIELYTLAGHTDGVAGVAVTLDGRHAISASADRTLKIWDLRSRNELGTLTGHDEEVEAVAITPDGQRAISGSRDRTVKIWDLEKQLELATLSGHLLWVWAVVVTPDARTAVSAAGDFTLKIWDLAKIDEPVVQKGHTEAVAAIAITSDGRRAISGSRDKTIRIWDLENKTELATLTGHSSTVCSVAISPDDRHAISGSLDGTLKLWNLEQCEELDEMTGHLDGINSVSITPDGRQAISGSKDRTIKIWDVSTGWTLKTLYGHDDWVSSVSVTPDGKRIISGSKDMTTKIWDLEEGTELATLAGHNNAVWAVAVTPDGRKAISGSYDRTIKIWDLETGEEIRTLIDQAIIFAVAVTPDGRRVISGNHDGEVTLWNIDSGSPIATFTADQGILACVALPNGKSFVVGGAFGQLQYIELIEI